MLNLIKIKYNMIFKSNISFLSVIITAIICTVSLFFAIIGKQTGDEVLTDMKSLIGLSSIFWIVSLLIAEAYLFNVYIVNDYITKKTNLLYSYPYKKNDHILSNLFLISFEIICVGIISYTIFMAFIVFIANPFIFSYVNTSSILIKSISIKAILQLIMITLNCGCMLLVAYKLKSTVGIFITSVVSAIFISMASNGFELSLSFEYMKVAILLFLSLVSIYIILRSESK